MNSCAREVRPARAKARTYGLWAARLKPCATQPVETSCYCSRVERSPISAPVSRAFKRRRMILPLRVFGSEGHEVDRRRRRDRSEFPANVIDQCGFQRVAGHVPGPQLHEGLDGLALERIGHADRRSFRNCRMRDQRTLDFRGANAMSCDIKHVVGAADHGDVSVLVAGRDVTGHVTTRHLLPLTHPAFVVLPDGSHHVREGPLQDQSSDDAIRRTLAFDVDHFGLHPRQRQPRFSGTHGQVTGVPSVGPPSSVCHQLSTT